MNEDTICYLDNAATTYPKPEAVIKEMERCMRSYCGNPGRGTHSLSLAAANKIYDCRCAAARLIGSSAPESIFFVPNSTYGLNAIIKGILKDGDHVIISDMEHNSVYRPIYKMAMENKISFDVFNALSLVGRKESPSAEKICADIQKLIRKNTKLLICNHSSNICSFSLPVKEIGELCHKNNIIFAVDSAQSAGHTDLNIEKMKIDYLCVPGHKALYGPQGSGFVAINNDTVLDTLIEGGNGIESLSGEMPLFSPERYESGTASTPCIAGLCEGIGEVLNIGTDTISEYEHFLFDKLLEDLLNIKDIVVYAPAYKGSTLSFNINGMSSDAVASALNKKSICVRGGFHCTALAHKALKTPNHGAVRASFSIFNTVKDIEKLSYVCKNIRTLI